jgi:hypothetical protein
MPLQAGCDPDGRARSVGDGSGRRESRETNSIVCIMISEPRDQTFFKFSSGWRASDELVLHVVTARGRGGPIP